MRTLRIATQAGSARGAVRSIPTVCLALIGVASGEVGCAPRAAEMGTTVGVTDVGAARADDRPGERRARERTVEPEAVPAVSQADASAKSSVDWALAPAKFAVKGMPARPLLEELGGKISMALAHCVSGCKPKEETGIAPIRSGWIIFEWSIDPSGAAKDVRVLRSELGSPSAEACMAAAIAGLTFASHAKSSDVVVTYPAYWNVPPCPIDGAEFAK